MNKFYHVFSEGENVLFREDSDYIFFNNKFAASCYAFRLQPLAESTMSTHFHSLIETTDDSAVDDFITKLRKAYALFYSYKYGVSLGNSFKITKLVITGREAIMNEFLYIMKNPVHHYVCELALQYRFSSVSYVFLESLMQPDYFHAFQTRTTKFADLTVRRKKQLLNTDIVPDDWYVMDNGMILPSSYIKVSKVRAFWNGKVKPFIYDIIKNQTDANQEIIDADILELRSSGMTDIDVCRLIDSYSKQSGHRSFHELDESEKESLINILKQKRIGDGQIKRCLWVR